MARRSDRGMAVIRRTGPATWMGNESWHHPWLVRDALCEDGKRRTVYLNQDSDTFFSWPGRTTIHGRSVTGFVTTSEDGDDTRFFANVKTRAQTPVPVPAVGRKRLTGTEDISRGRYHSAD